MPLSLTKKSMLTQSGFLAEPTMDPTLPPLLLGQIPVGGGFAVDLCTTDGGAQRWRVGKRAPIQCDANQRHNSPYSVARF